MKIGLNYREHLYGLSPYLAEELDRLVSALQRFLSPGSGLTAENTGAANSGDATTDAVITNTRTRVSEIETLLRSKGWL